MSVTLDNNKNPSLYLLKSIEICNKSRDWMIDRNFTVCQRNEGLKATDAAVIQKWLNLCTQNLPKMRLDEVKTTLLTFIHTSSELTLIEKQEFTTAAINAVLSCNDQITPYKAIQHLLRQPKLNAEELKMLDIALGGMAAERISYSYLLLWLSAEWYKTILLELFETGGGFLKSCPDQSSFTIDWERKLSLTPDEFAIAARLLDAHSNDRKSFLSVMRELKKEILESEQKPPQVFQIWHTFILICDVERIKTAFMNILATTPGPFLRYSLEAGGIDLFSNEIQKVFSAVHEISKAEATSTTGSSDEKKKHIYNRIAIILQLAKRYLWQNQWLDALYKNTYETFEKQGKRVKQYKKATLPSIIGSRHYRPEEFAEIKIPSISLDDLETKIKEDFPSYLTLHLDKNELYPFEQFLHYVIDSDAQNPFITNLRARFCEKIGFSPVAKLTEELGALCITTKKKPKQKIAKAQRTIAPEVLATKQPKGPSKFIVKELALRIDSRVKDWYRLSPKAWQKAPYITLAQNEKDEAKLLHSIPLVVTKILVQFIKHPEDWENKEHKLYRRPGTIHEYAANKDPIEGSFACCFDQDGTLYHHFFHKIAFSRLIERYKQKGSPPSLEEQERIAYDAKKLRTVSEGNVEINGLTHVDNRFDITRTTGSVIVDDTATKIKYTLCFPEWIGS